MRARLPRFCCAVSSAVSCVLAGVALTGCGQQPATTSPQPYRSPDVRTHAPQPVGATSAPAASDVTASVTPTLAPTTTPPGTPSPTPSETAPTTVPDTLPELPGTGFDFRVTGVPPEVLARSTWSPSCDIGSDRLKWIVLTFRGFDDRRHTGELLVDRSVVPDVVEAFRELWDQRQPLEEMAIVSKTDLTSPPADTHDTNAFLCRPVEKGYSPEDQGLTVDVYPPTPTVRHVFADLDWTWSGPAHPTRFTAP